MAWHVTLKAPKFIKLKLKVSTNSQIEGEKKAMKKNTFRSDRKR